MHRSILSAVLLFAAPGLALAQSDQTTPPLATANMTAADCLKFNKDFPHLPKSEQEQKKYVLDYCSRFVSTDLAIPGQPGSHPGIQARGPNFLERALGMLTAPFRSLKQKGPSA